MAGSVGLILACAWAACAVAAVLGTDAVSLRSIACAPLALYWPGYCFLRATRHESRSALEWHGLAAMWSMASLILAGFVLNRAHVLEPRGWVVWLAGVVWVLATVAFVRQRKVPAPPKRACIVPVAPGPAAVFFLALIVTGAAVALAVWDTQTWREFRYTEFWMLPDDHERPALVTIGARNEEQRPMQYDIEVRRDGALLAGWRSVRLDPSERLIRTLPITPSNHGDSTGEAWLFTSGSNEIYRKVSLDVPGR